MTYLAMNDSDPSRVDFITIKNLPGRTFLSFGTFSFNITLNVPRSIRPLTSANFAAIAPLDVIRTFPGPIMSVKSIKSGSFGDLNESKPVLRSERKAWKSCRGF